jgi:hypothetical protein
MPDGEWMDGRPLLVEALFTLDDVLGTTVKAFVYEYDFGDGWSHDITVQAIELVDEERNGWPMYLAGANACPPEDVGGRHHTRHGTADRARLDPVPGAPTANGNEQCAGPAHRRGIGRGPHSAS